MLRHLHAPPMSMLLLFTGPSIMRLPLLLFILLLFLALVHPGKAGVIPGLKQCVNLKGVCKDKGCTSIETDIGVCNDEKKCCRKWWIFEPYPTPIPKGKSP
ncbi:beta-defensin 130-like [Carlito syrichta]|uniref:Beta-defensin 130-like n=1 Tax=Carlito syrichta TaxID=1868482 RepID=A0A3Q0DJ67_CARSF|nr:beta-defensin 130-like [Carlito syrichta]